MYARLAHNYALQSAARDHFADACERIASLHVLYATKVADKAGDVWDLNRERADELADAAATAVTTLKGLMWRTRWNLKFEDGIVRGAKNYDEVLMNLSGSNH
jgi:hypothetical protein